MNTDTIEIRRESTTQVNSEVQKENPVLALKAASVCLHFVERDFVQREANRDKHEDEADPFFGSMELDLLNYQFQVDRPLVSRHIGRIKNEIGIMFPESFQYKSEGRTVTLKREDIEGKNEDIEGKKVDCMLSATEFKDSKIRIWHLTLHTADSPFNEFEIIKLISLYDGRSEGTGPYDHSSEQSKLANKINFKFIHLRHSISLIGLIGMLGFNDINFFSRDKDKPPKLQLKSGTIQLLLKDEETKELLWNAVGARSKKSKAKFAQASDINTRPQDATRRVMAQMGYQAKTLQALSGIVIGIFDFGETDFEEIVDTFEPSFEDGHVFIKFNRCTLLSIAQDDRAFETCKETIGISPYLIIPHAVLIHNEELIQMADEEIEPTRNQTFLQQFSRLDITEDAYNAANKYLHWRLPTIFNYPTETIIFKQGKKKRGSTQKFKMVKSQLLELEKIIEEKWELRRGIAAAFIMGIGTLIAALQASEAIYKDSQNQNSGSKDLSSVLELIDWPWFIIIFIMFMPFIVMVLSLGGVKFNKIETKKFL